MISNGKAYSHFKWSFSTLGCPELNLMEICSLARDFGIRYVELRATENTVDLPALFSEQYGTPEALAAFLQEQQVAICCLDTSLKLVGNTEEDREAFLQFLPWAEGIGTRFLRVFDGGTVPDGLNDEAFVQASDTLDWWIAQRAENGWKADIAIETHDCLVHHQSLNRIRESYPDLNIIWDTHHTWKKSEDSIETSWQHTGPNTCSTHIKDSISEPSARHPFTYVNLGDGEFPLQATLDLLKANDFDGFVSIEWERMWHPYLTDIRDALNRARTLNWF